MHGNEDLAAYLAAESTDKGFWADMGIYMVSLLKAWWGDAAVAGNDFCYDYLPRLTGSHSTYETVVAQIEGKCQGYFLFGENPAVGSANGRMQRFGLASLDWLVVRDLVMIESATFWQNGPEIETGEMRTRDIGTEVFFLPAAAHTTSVAGSGRSSPPPPTRWTGRCRTSPGTTRSRGRWPSRRPRRCWPRSTAGTARASRCPPTPSSRTTGPRRAAAGSTAVSAPAA